MPSAVEISVWCAGAWRLGRFDATGMSAFGNSADIAWRSFFAALLVAPLWFLVSVLSFAVVGDDAQIDASIGRYVLVESIAYVIGWTAFPVVMAGVCDRLNRRGRFLRFVAAYNWTSLIQNVIYLPVMLAGLSGLIPSEGAMFLGLVTIMWALAYEAFVIRHALDIPLPWAAALVAFDVVLAFLIEATGDVVL